MLTQLMSVLSFPKKLMYTRRFIPTACQLDSDVRGSLQNLFSLSVWSPLKRRYAVKRASILFAATPISILIAASIATVQGKSIKYAVKPIGPECRQYGQGTGINDRGKVCGWISGMGTDSSFVVDDNKVIRIEPAGEKYAIEAAS